MSISRIIYKSRLLSKLSCAILRLKNRNYIYEVQNRSSLNLFSYKKIACDLPKYYKEIITDNNCFGIGYCIRNYSGWKKSYIDAFIEHGYFFGSYVSDQEQITFAKNIFTFGDVRVEHIKRKVTNKNVIPIGPYIHYAKPYLSDKEFEEMKANLGKTILVFFSHSATGCSVSFDIDYLISKIEEIRHFYDSVVISLFWSDISQELENKIINKGYRIFTAGHRYDYNFLSRLRSMIELADMTMSNSVGTHIAYCTHLNKPHWIIRQEIKGIGLNEKGIANMAISDWQASDSAHKEELDELYNIFADYNDKLSSEQKKACNKYFGYDYVKTPDEMFHLLKAI